MWPYLLMFAVPALFAMAESVRLVGGRMAFVWCVAVAVLTVLIGYRFQVGGDWETYLMMFDRSSQSDLADYLLQGDVSYQLINWVSNRLGWGIYGVNLLTGAIFSFGLVAFCRAQVQPWLAFAIAVPYLVIVVGMGYSRQAAALGLEMLALRALGLGRIVSFGLLVVAAASFHKSAVIVMFLIAVVIDSKKQFIAFLILFPLLGLASTNYILTTADDYSRAYLDTAYESQGAAIRLLLNLIPSAIMLVWRHRLGYNRISKRLWLCFSILSIFCLILLAYSPSSTAVDRVALYLLPLQIAVLSRLPAFIAFSLGAGRQLALPNPLGMITTALVLSFYGLVEFVWLTRAQTAFAWLPYRSFLLERNI